MNVGSGVLYLPMADSQCVGGCELRQSTVKQECLRHLRFHALACSMMIYIDIVAYVDCYFIEGIFFATVISCLLSYLTSCI